MTDVLLLGMSRVGAGITIAGMTTEADPITGLRWARPIPPAALTLEDLRCDDGSYARLGDVLRLDLGPATTEPPFTENVPLVGGLHPAQRVRHLSAAKRPGFFAAHCDREPKAVLTKTPARSLCLVQPDELHATFSVDEETGKYEARILFGVGDIPARGAGLLVTDVYWRAFGRQFVAEEPFAEFDAAELHAQVGAMFLAVGLNSKRVHQIIGVHSVPEYAAELDAADL